MDLQEPTMCKGLSSRSSILTFGDSQGEVLDFVFHGDSRYILHEDDARVGWYSSWSTRGLKKGIHKARILESVGEQLQRDDLDKVFVFLSFGSVDIEWNLAYKRDVQNENPDTGVFIGEMTDALLGVITEMQALATSSGPMLQIVLCFPFAPLPLAEDYMIRYAKSTPAAGPGYRVFSREERHSLWKRFIESMTQAVAGLDTSVPVVDVTPDFEEKGYEAFMHVGKEDHHPDFIKTQGPLAERIRSLEIAGLEPHPPLKELYPHYRRALPTTVVPAPHRPVAMPMKEQPLVLNVARLEAPVQINSPRVA